MTYISNAVTDDMQGWAMGVAAAVGSLAWGIAALIVGAVIHVDPRLPFLLSAAVFFACCVCVHYYQRVYPEEVATS